MTESIQGLERGKFTPESNSDESTVRTTVASGAVGEDDDTLTRNNVRNDQLIASQGEILKELKKLNMYFALITNTKL